MARQYFPLPPEVDGETLRNEMLAAGVSERVYFSITTDDNGTQSLAFEWPDEDVVVDSSALASVVQNHKGQSQEVTDRIRKSNVNPDERITQLESVVDELILSSLGA